MVCLQVLIMIQQGHVEIGIVRALIVGELNSLTGMAVQHAGEQILQIIAPLPEKFRCIKAYLMAGDISITGKIIDLRCRMNFTFLQLIANIPHCIFHLYKKTSQCRQ